MDLMLHFKKFHLFELNAKQNKIWKEMWVAMLWRIWNHRNKIIFKNNKVDVEELFCMTQLYFSL